MSFRSFLTALTRTARNRKSPRRPRLQLAVEALEHRLVPAALSAHSPGAVIVPDAALTPQRIEPADGDTRQGADGKVSGRTVTETMKNPDGSTTIMTVEYGPDGEEKGRSTRTQPAGPVGSVATTVGLSPDSDTGVVGDGITSVTSPVLVGTATPGATVEVAVDNTFVGLALAGPDGAWTFGTELPALNLNDGAHFIEASVPDQPGDDALLALVIDTIAPAVAAALAPASDSGTPGDNLTNVTAPTLVITTEPGLTIRLSVDDLPPIQGVAGADGSVELTIPPGFTLGDGAHTFDVSAADAAGNLGSMFLGVTVDTESPDTTFAPRQSAQFISFALRALHGDTADTGSSFEYSLDGGPFTSCDNSLLLGPLPDGSHSCLFRATDAAGNTDATPASFSWSVDTVRPTVNVNPVPTSTLGVPLTITGAAGDVGSGVSSVQVLIRRASDNAIVFSGPAVNTGSGCSNWWVSYLPTQPGGYVVQATATDAAGNVATASPMTFVVM
jgi:hypothetical protein